VFSFSRRRERVEISGFIRHLVNVTTPNLPPTGGEQREQRRVNRSLPVLLAPWVGKRPLVDQAVTAMTKDIGDVSVGVVMQKPLAAVEQVALGFMLPVRDGTNLESEPSFVLGNVRQIAPIGGGYWLAGIELDRILGTSGGAHFDELVAMTKQLTPPHGAPSS